MRINKLLGCGVAGTNDRCTGRSEALAFKAIYDALANPGLVIRVSDHHSSRGADRLLFTRVCQIIDKLELKCMQKNSADLSICFDLYEYAKTPPDMVMVDGVLYKRA